MIVSVDQQSGGCRVRNHSWTEAFLVSLIACALPALAAAQQKTSTASKSDASDIEEVVISGTRLRAEGFEAPTPVTVAEVESLLNAGPTNVVNALQELPQFLGSVNYTSGGKSGIGDGRGQFLSLRNFGAGRTLVMLDGVRMPPTTYDGRVNSEIFPQLLLKRVDIVTAGASAAYGSDAVAGAVNYILDHDLVGMKVDASSGVSSRSDAFNYRVGVAGGFKMGERGHALVSVERFKTAGFELGERSQGIDSYIAAGRTPGGGPQGLAANPYVIYSNAVWNNLGVGGLILSGPLAGATGIYFDRAGSFRPRVAGTPTGASNTSIGGDGVALQRNQSVAEDAVADQGLVRLSYELTDKLEAHLLGIYSKSTASITGGFNYFDFGHTVFSGNPFIPAALQTTMTAQNIASFSLQKYVTDSPLSPAVDETRHYTILAGLDGSFEAFGRDLRWSATIAHGDTHQSAEEVNTPELRKFHAAVDAVRDPATGNIVCRVTLTNPGLYPGCVPFNIMGENAASQAAVDYIHGTSTYGTDVKLDQVSLSLQGDLFQLPAGPVSFAIGGEHRKQTLSLVSNSDPAVVRPVDGLRSLALTQPRFWFSNRASARSSLSVDEEFAEINIPVLRDVPLLRSLDLNGAVRFTDYSTSGNVKTWKGGLTWRPFEDVLLRLTKSRDIRAPSLFDLGSSGSSSRTTLVDPLTGRSDVVPTTGGGNPNLVPEIGDTLTYGIVLQPSFAPGLSIAFDIFDIDLRGAISTLSAANIVNQCFFSGGVDPICGQITRPISATSTSPANFPTLILTGPTNSSIISTRGFDLELAYNSKLGPGNLSTHLYVSHIGAYKTQASPFLPVVENAGTNVVPDLKANLQVVYAFDKFSVALQERMIGKITLGQLPNNIWAVPPVAAQYYTDLTARYPMEVRSAKVDLFLTVKNLFDRAPPLVPNTAAPRFNFPTLPFYDIVGTTFSFGARTTF